MGRSYVAHETLVVAQGSPMSRPCVAHGSPTGHPWVADGFPIGHPYAAHKILVAAHWSAMGLP